MKNTVYFVEHLNAIAWFREILPYLMKTKRHEGRSTSLLYFIDATRTGYALARGTAWLAGIVLRRFDFRIADIRDEDGLCLRLRIHYRDLGELQEYILATHPLHTFIASLESPELRGFLEKAIPTVGGTLKRGTPWRALIVIQVCRWKARQEGRAESIVLFIECQPWRSAIASYGKRWGMTVIGVKGACDARRWFRAIFPHSSIEYMRRARSRLYNFRLGVYRTRQLAVRDASVSLSPKISIEHTGHLNLDNPALYSDLFFWQQSKLSGSDLLLLFRFVSDPLDKEKLQQLAHHGIRAVALYPGASVVPAVPVFVPRGFPRISRIAIPSIFKRDEQRWLRRQIEEYEIQRMYWKEVFTAHQIKVALTWYQYDPQHYAMAAAIRELGGVMAIYQRSFQAYASPEITAEADIMFGYAPFDAAVERRCRSRISYHVSVGYLHDHLSSLLRATALRVRQQLQRSGAQYIVSYFDGNSFDDGRWNSDSAFRRVSYIFLFEKLLREQWFGLIIKPKYVGNFRQRLGPVAELLERALQTGRCFLYEEGQLHNSYPPVIAALSADLAIEGHLCAATAGLESALAGVPTLLLDREGWQVSPLYQLGVGKVVFRNWEELWGALEVHRRHPDGIAGFGDWSPMINKFDPFRDGRAAERMGTYLKWVLDGLKAGGRRDTVLADAAKRYQKTWGEDKVTRLI